MWLQYSKEERENGTLRERGKASTKHSDLVDQDMEFTFIENKMRKLLENFGKGLTSNFHVKIVLLPPWRRREHISSTFVPTSEIGSRKHYQFGIK